MPGARRAPQPAAGLVADEARLFFGGGAGEEDGGGVVGRVGWADGDPALALLGDGGVLDEGEAELADVESERLVIVADDEGDVGHCSDVVQLDKHLMIILMPWFWHVIFIHASKKDRIFNVSIQ